MNKNKKANFDLRPLSLLFHLRRAVEEVVGDGGIEEEESDGVQKHR